MCGRRHTFASINTFQDTGNLQLHLELILVSLQKFEFLGYTSRKTKMSVVQGDYFAPDTRMCSEDIDKCFRQVL